MKKAFLLAIFICSVVFLQAQKLKGDLSPLSGQKEINNPAKLKGVVTILSGTTSIATIQFNGIAGNVFFMTPIHEHCVSAAFEELGETVGKILHKKVK